MSILQDLLNIGFFEIGTSDPDIRVFRLYEEYKGIRLRIIVTLKDDILKVDHVFFYSPNSDELQFELFGQDVTAAKVIERIRELHKSSKPFNEGTETG